MVKSVSVLGVLKDTLRISLYAELISIIKSLGLKMMGCSANGMFSISPEGSWVMTIESGSIESPCQAIQTGICTSGSEGDARSEGVVGVAVGDWAGDGVVDQDCFWLLVCGVGRGLVGTGASFITSSLS